jgi:hypothetical protein
MLVAAESGVIDFSVRTLGDNDTVDTELSAKNSERLQNHGEQHERTHGLNTNEKDQSQEGQVGTLVWNHFTCILATEFNTYLQTQCKLF